MSYFAMKISGQPENVNDYVQNLRRKREGIIRFDFDPTQFEVDQKCRLMSIVGEGVCTGTIERAMPNLKEETNN